MASVGFWDPSMGAPPARNLGAGRATKKEKKVGSAYRASCRSERQDARGCRNAIKAYTDLQTPPRKSFFLPVGQLY